MPFQPNMRSSFFQLRRCQVHATPTSFPGTSGPCSRMHHWTAGTKMTLPSPLVTSPTQQAGSSTTWTPTKIPSASIVPVNSQTTTPGTSKLLKHRKCKEFLDAIMFYQLYAYLTSHLPSPLSTSRPTKRWSPTSQDASQKLVSWTLGWPNARKDTTSRPTTSSLLQHLLACRRNRPSATTIVGPTLSITAQIGR